MFRKGGLSYIVAKIILYISIFIIGGLGIWWGAKFILSNTNNEGVEFVIGISQANLIEPWRMTMTDEIREEIEKYDNISAIYTEASGSTEKQIEDIHKLVGYGIDLLIVSPNDAEDLTPLITQVYKSLPVIVLDRGVKGYDYTLYIGPDNFMVGEQVGELIIDLAKGEQLNVIEIEGSPNSHPTRERHEGLIKVIQEVDTIHELARINGNWKKDLAEDEMNKILNLYSDIDLIFAHNDAMAVGAYKAYEEQNDFKKPKIIGVDGLDGPEDGIELVKQGILDATFRCPTGGKEAIQYAMQILEGNNIVPKKIVLRPELVTMETLKEEENTVVVSQVKKVEDMTIGFCSVGKEGGWRKAHTMSLKEAANDVGINLIMRDSELNQQNQIKILEDFIEEGVDAIILSPIVETGWDAVLYKAEANDIPVILSDRNIQVKDKSLYPTFVGSDFREEGARAARWMLEEFENKSHINIIEISGTENATPTKERGDGFRSEIESYPNIEIIASQTGGFTLEGGKSAMRKILYDIGTERIDVIYAHNDDMALGAIKILEENGIDPGKDIKIVSNDGTKEAILAIKEGKINCSVECSPLLGPQIIKTSIDAINRVELPLRIITEESVFTQTEYTDEWLKRPY